MNIEHYAYVLVVAGIGMGIVFVFLSILSLLMSAIRMAFRERRNNSQPSPSGVPASTTPVVSGAPTGWLVAAVAAYLQIEKSGRTPDPKPWVVGRTPQTDPWLR